ncbi:response regulator transcription factor [Thalassomonas actiniarum]|uniref:Response regulator transcription factor n=1 Tax=Thalassomonas actiniarum TaxID=485447 RepID=A0AAE9YUP7_9GAMM|nr:response regulator transcription factor [Thalassomonas actiniarum]WDE00699.1 response regulator transcription factor [Thalassomonas actiniarum]
MSLSQVIIADDHPLFRAALKQALCQCIAGEYLENGSPQDETILETDNFDDLIALIEAQSAIELVFLDLHMPGSTGFSGLTRLLNHYPDVAVVMISSEDNPDIMRKAIDLGACAFIPKSADFTTIARAVNTVTEGNTWLPESLLAEQSRQLHHREAQSPDKKLAEKLAQLTPQQYTVLELIADGQLNKQIAYRLNIRETTVKKHVSAILAKFEINNRTQAGIAFQQLNAAHHH